MPFYPDQLGRMVELPGLPKRIISTVPSQTELLYDLHLTEEVIGITKFCVHPVNWFRTKTRIGGPKQLDLDKIQELKPDLIIANKEENVQEQIEALAQTFPVWISDVKDFTTALEMIAGVGAITGKAKESAALITEIRSRFSNLKYDACQPKPRTAYLIWKDPYMTAGGDTFIHDMLTRAGFENIFFDRERYPQLQLDELRSLNCELLLLSSEPYPFRQKHMDQLKEQLPETKIILADGELFSWYGSRLLKAPAYFDQIRKDIQALSLF